MVSAFYWMIEGALAGCSRPGAPAPLRQRENAPDAESVLAQLESDLAWLRAQGIGALLSLTETPLHADPLLRQGLQTLHLPIPDLTAPTPEQFLQALSFIDRQRAAGRAVAVHCLVGQGRTGTVLASYLIRAGQTPAAAIATVRRRCPGAIGSPEQERALQAFADRRDWLF